MKLLVMILLTTSLCFSQERTIREGEPNAIDAYDSIEGTVQYVKKSIDPYVDIWKAKRQSFLNNPNREPGPIVVQKWEFQHAAMGIPTFFQQPIALTPEDLIAGEVDVAIMGAGIDQGTGMRGAVYGPQKARASAIYVPGSRLSMVPHLGTGINPFKELNVVDYGDAPLDMFSIERSIQPIADMVEEIAQTGTIPFIVGGDHTLMYPDVVGLSRVYGKGKIGVIHFDSHYDAETHMLGHLISHGQPVARLIEEGWVSGKNFVQVGLRGYFPSEEEFEKIRHWGLRYHTMAEVEVKGWDYVLEKALAEAMDGCDYLFISLDIDVLDPVYAPGTGTPEPAGLTTRELFPLLRRLTAEKNVVGMEIVEFNPIVDPTYLTAQTVNRCMREMLVGIALKKKGITKKDYHSEIQTNTGEYSDGWEKSKKNN
ncbi:agmatinase family protein [Lutimonas zeaxanthinifaciens]|uniref:agmatinase family protein n=1 Tax=Lutimonas zeaxanthinifaciens TaxID=3060215 RepID=UPI00265CA4F0|nr:agmatinase family protein [Lutimonas sp. YSD2104]WKK65734.1 agmatinase family protein [Lutimonas sp. YSD2104]